MWGSTVRRPQQRSLQGTPRKGTRQFQNHRSSLHGLSTPDFRDAKALGWHDLFIHGPVKLSSCDRIWGFLVVECLEGGGDHTFGLMLIVVQLRREVVWTNFSNHT